MAYLLGMVVAFAVNFGPCRRGEITLTKRNLRTLFWPLYGLVGLLLMIHSFWARLRQPASATNR